jgi:hypothetical protein
MVAGGVILELYQNQFIVAIANGFREISFLEELSDGYYTKAREKNHAQDKFYQTNTNPPIRLKPGDSGGIIREWAKATFLLINLETIGSLVRWVVTRI